MSTRLETARYHDTKSGVDKIVLTIRLEKEDTGALMLHRIRAKVTPLDGNGKPVYVDFEGLDRVIPGEQSQWQTDVSNRNIALPPGESTQFSAVAPVSPDIAYLVEVSVQGRRQFSPRLSQWKTTAVSAPAGWEELGSKPNQSQGPTPKHTVKGASP